MAKLTQLENRLAQDRTGASAAAYLELLASERIRVDQHLAQEACATEQRRLLAVIEAIDAAREVIEVLSARYRRRQKA